MVCVFSQSSLPHPATKLQFPAPSPPHHLQFHEASVPQQLRPPFLAPAAFFPLAKFAPFRCSCLASPVEAQKDVGLLLFPLFGEMGLTDRETELVLERNPVLQFTALDSARARLSLLQAVGIKGLELYRVITKRPTVLVAEEVDQFLRFCLSGLPELVDPAQLRRLLVAAEPRSLLSFPEKVELLLESGVPQGKIVHVLNNVNLAKALAYKSVAEIRRTVEFLIRYGGGTVHMIIKRPQLLNFDLETQLIPRVEFLKQLSGGDEEATGKVLRKLPAFLSYSIEHVEGHVEFFRSFAGLTDLQIFKIYLVFPNVISASKERKLRPRIEFLKQCGLNSEEMSKFLTKAPLLLGLSYEENLVHKLVFLVKIGYGYPSKELAAAMGAVTRTSCENLQKVIGVLLSYGLACDDILTMSTKHPQVLQYNYESLEKKMDYLTEGMGRDVGELLAFPAFLGYNLDTRIKPRYEFKRDTLGEGLSINKLLTMSAGRFSDGKSIKS